MNITSLLITLAGIIIILALYIMSRVTQSKLPNKQTSIIPNLKDEKGDKFTSVLDDIPARDSSTAVVETGKEPAQETIKTEEQKEQAVTDEQQQQSETAATSTTKKIETTQHILFISAKDENGLDGNQVQQALKSNGLIFGEMDIYHYMVNLENDTGMTSLFRVANGMTPWTLIDTDLLNKKLAGLSIVMMTPSKIDDQKAMKTFISITEKLSKSVDGILKNHEQQPFTEEDKIILTSSIKN